MVISRVSYARGRWFDSTNRYQIRVLTATHLNIKAIIFDTLNAPCYFSWGVAQLIEQRILIPSVVGLSPTSSAKAVLEWPCCNGSNTECDSVSVSSILTGHPKAALADVVIAMV